MIDESNNTELDNVHKQINELKAELGELLQQREDILYSIKETNLYRNEYKGLCDPLPSTEEFEQKLIENERKIQAVKTKIRYRENKLRSNRSDQAQTQQISQNTLSYLNTREKTEQEKQERNERIKSMLQPPPKKSNQFNYNSINIIPPDNRGQYAQYQTMAGNPMQYTINTMPARQKARLNKTINDIIRNCFKK